jgi:hypothetical protein
VVSTWYEFVEHQTAVQVPQLALLVLVHEQEWPGQRNPEPWAQLAGFACALWTLYELVEHLTAVLLLARWVCGLSMLTVPEAGRAAQLAHLVCGQSTLTVSEVELSAQLARWVCVVLKLTRSSLALAAQLLEPGLVHLALPSTSSVHVEALHYNSS